MSPLQIQYAPILCNVIAVIILAVCWRWKTAGRFLFVLVFLWAALYNFWMAFARPEEYLTYARFAYSTWYQLFILVFFTRHTTAVVATIALGQLAIAVLISLRGTAVHLGLIGAIFFLVAIAPLGTGAAFPATVIAAGGASLLLQNRYASSLRYALSEVLGGHHQATA